MTEPKKVTSPKIGTTWTSERSSFNACSENDVMETKSQEVGNLKNGRNTNLRINKSSNQLKSGQFSSNLVLQLTSEYCSCYPSSHNCRKGRLQITKKLLKEMTSLTQLEVGTGGRVAFSQCFWGRYKTNPNATRFLLGDKLIPSHQRPKFLIKYFIPFKKGMDPLITKFVCFVSTNGPFRTLASPNFVPFDLKL